MQENKQVTVPDILEAIRREAMRELDPDRAVLLLQKLSALLGTVTDEWITAEMNFNRYYETMTTKFEKVTEAKAHAKASMEYEWKLRAEGLLDVTKELINSLKYSIKNKLSERQESRYQ
jgi:hypothetical protein